MKIEITNTEYEEAVQTNVHHIWCNYYFSKKVSDCPMCKRFFEEYPMKGGSPDDLLKVYFPSVIKRV